LAGAILALGVLGWFLFSLPADERPSWLHRRGFGIAASALLGGLFLLAMLFVGPTARNQMDERLQAAVSQQHDKDGRGALWMDSLKMLRDFPLFGVGLGSWPEIFPRYQRPPFSEASFAREPENDYVQFLSETGIIGAVLAGWVLLSLAGALWHRSGAVPQDYLPLFGALIAGAAATAFHEFFDLCLHVPANALLLTVMLAMALRLGLGEQTLRSMQRTSRVATIGSGCVLVSLLAGLYWLQPADYKPEEPVSPSDTVQLINSHPGRADLHLSLLELSGPALTPEQVSFEVAAIMWLQPTNPYARDLHAAMLIGQGHESEGLNEVTRAIYYSPDPSTHPYLAPKMVPRLLPRERNAIEAGFRQSVNARFDGAVDGLAHFYHLLSRMSDEAKVYEAAAAWEEPFDRRRHLLDAGIAYADAGEPVAAERVLRQAAANDPSDPQPYRELVLRVFVPRKDLAAAKDVLAEGINQGADEATLIAALADAAGMAGNEAEQNAALVKAVALQPGSYDLNLRLGASYLGLRDCDRAAGALLKAAELSPRSAEAFYTLGAAEEQCYQFDSAENAYERAAQLQPSNSQYRQTLENFQRRLAENRPTTH
jgi:Flp pilus assembly protein TadD